MNTIIISQNRDYTGIDIFKFLMAFAVIAIHCRLDNIMGEGDWSRPVRYILGMAVPFFFITSGFLIAQKISNPNISDTDKQLLLRKRAYTIFRIFSYWLIIYLPIAIYSYISDGTDIWKAIAGYIYKIATGGHSIWAWQLWFIYSMAWVILIYSVTLLSTRTTILLMLSFTIISLITTGFQTYGLSILKWPYILTHSTLGGGIYITAGVIIYKIKHIYHQIYTAVLLLVASISLYIFELPFYQIIGGCAFFIFALNISISSNPLFLTLRRLSMWIYYLHMIVVFSISQFFPICKMSLFQIFILASLTTLLLAIIVDSSQRKIYSLRFLGALIR